MKDSEVQHGEKTERDFREPLNAYGAFREHLAFICLPKPTKGDDIHCHFCENCELQSALLDHCSNAPK
jgi:hypothetical protein